MNIPVESIPKQDAVAIAVDFVGMRNLEWVQSAWNKNGHAEFTFSRGDFERLCKVLLVGIGELSK